MLFSSEVCSDFQRAVPSSSPVLKCTWCLGGRCLCVLISFNDGENSWAKKAKSRGTIVRWQWALGVGWQLSSAWAGTERNIFSSLDPIHYYLFFTSTAALGNIIDSIRLVLDFIAPWMCWWKQNPEYLSHFQLLASVKMEWLKFNNCSDINLSFNLTASDH